jgi:hypothetical protein
MADSFLTVSDFVSDKLDVLQTATSNILNAAPFLSMMPRLSPSGGGITHKYNVYTTAPTVGYRTEGVGRNMSESGDTVTTLTLKILDFTWMIDVASAQGWGRGAGDLIAREGARHLQAALFKFEKQILNGTTGVGDANGTVGFRNWSYTDAIADTAMVTNAAGTTAATGSSVWLVRLGQDDVATVTTDDFNIGNTIEQLYTVADASYPVYATPACLWTGLQIGGAYSLGRICNLTADSGKGLTDALLYTAFNKFPAGAGPTHLVMSRRSRGQLQASRTATTTTGAPAPLPQEWEGIPIIVTDAQSDTEVILA